MPAPLVRFSVVLAFAGCACGGPPAANDLVLGAGERLLAKDPSALADNAVFVDAEGPTPDAGVALVAAAFDDIGALDAHHDVLRARLGTGQFLFALVNEVGLVSLAAILPVPGEGIPDDDGAVAHYQAAWNESAPSLRRDLLEQSWATDGRFVDPSSDVDGRADLLEHIATTRSQTPGSSFASVGGVQERGPVLTFAWRMEVLGLGVLDGVDVGVLDDDDHLGLIAGFWGALPR